jgi:radical SAM/CxCxxxxC motif protein YfkAB
VRNPITPAAGNLAALPPLSPKYDPWDPLLSLQTYGRHVLTSVEFTVTNLCNMRCEHCAVGDSLAMKEGARLPIDLVLKRLDEVERLETISITGGEPMLREETVRDVILPLLRYARARGVRSQINSNATLELGRYEAVAPYLDVLHISFNYTGPADFHRVGFVRADREVSRGTADKLYKRMVDNTVALARGGLFVSAETMINFRTHTKLAEIHRLIVEMGCRRHEVHPMYPSAFAKDLPLLTLDELRTAVHALLDARDPSVWMLFGTLPFFACSELEADLMLIERLRAEPNVTVRGDPDGRNRLNVNLFTGDVYVTDFAAEPPLGNILREPLEAIFAKWSRHPLHLRVNCHCPAAACCGPNLLVADSYYRGVDFHQRKAIV